ncbi:hypothetical protein GQX73_g10056 [Xylaria multiplex]|uniref:PH domain-containing protein n=1 Tax=Xylaria multiplex TaxID=323545 RepID=A0A7C8MIZ4_9PEZI|nr:hypothetical protein GQX73_g10056 [Xylaria multiplex]
MDPIIAAQQILPEKSQRRPSFSPIKAIRSLSISSQISHLSISSDTDASSSGTRRRTLQKIAPPGALRKEGLIRNDSMSTDDSVGRDSTSTQPTTPSIMSRSMSIRRDPVPVIKSGPLQPQSSILKAKKEYLVLTSSTLFKFRNYAAAQQQFPNISMFEQGLNPLSPIESHTSLKDLLSRADISVPLEKVVSVFKGEGTRPSFGLEIWWKCSNATKVFSSLEFDFHLPDEQDDWLRQIRQAAKARTKAVGEERAPPEIEASFTLILDAKNEDGSLLDIYPVIPRRPYTRLAGEPKKNWRESSSFYLAFTKYSVLLAQFSGTSNGQKVNPSLVQFGLVTLSRVRVNTNDERFDLIFRLPLDHPQTLKLSSRYHRNILTKLFKVDTYLKPAWPLWTRQDVFYIDDDTQQIPLPNGEDYGGFKTTLEAFIEGYHCQPVEWSVKWKDVRHAPSFCLLKPKDQSRYNAHQLLAVFRALNVETVCGIMKYLELDNSNELRRLSLNNCALTGELVTGIFCRIGTGQDIHLSLNGNPLEAGSTDWIDLIHGNEAPSKLHLDMIHFQHESTFNKLLIALSHNKTIEFLSMIDLSGYSGKLEDGQLGWGLPGALSGLKDNTSLRQLRLRNHDMGATGGDLTELCRILIANKGLAMFDIQHNNFDHHQFCELVTALNHNHQLISFPTSQVDREYAISKEKRLFLETQGCAMTKGHDKLSKSAESRLNDTLTRLVNFWESEARRAKSILERNRDNPANQPLELKGEYLEAWGDEDLPPWVWLASKKTQQRQKEVV